MQRPCMRCEQPWSEFSRLARPRRNYLFLQYITLVLGAKHWKHIDTGRVTMYGETTVHIGNSIVDVEDNYRIHVDRHGAIWDGVSTHMLCKWEWLFSGARTCNDLTWGVSSHKVNFVSNSWPLQLWTQRVGNHGQGIVYLHSTSAFILAEILVRSPRKLFVFVMKINFTGSRYPKNTSLLLNTK